MYYIYKALVACTFALLAYIAICMFLDGIGCDVYDNGGEDGPQRG